MLNLYPTDPTADLFIPPAVDSMGKPIRSDVFLLRFIKKNLESWIHYSKGRCHFPYLINDTNIRVSWRMESTGWGNRDFSPGFLGRLGHKLAFIFCVCRSKDFVPDLPVEYDRIVDYDAARSDVIRRVVSSCAGNAVFHSFLVPSMDTGMPYSITMEGSILIQLEPYIGACKMSGSDFGMIYNQECHIMPSCASQDFLVVKDLAPILDRINDHDLISYTTAGQSCQRGTFSSLAV